MVQNPDLAAAVTDWETALRIRRVAAKSMNEAVNDLLPSEDARTQKWQAARRAEGKLRQRMLNMAAEAVDAAEAAGDHAAYVTAVADQHYIWHII